MSEPDRPETRKEERRHGARREEDKRKKRKFDPKILLIIAALGAVIFLWWRKNQQQEEVTQAINSPVKIMRPVYGTIQKDFRISGNIETESMVTVLPKISGTLESLEVDVGDKVKKDEVIGEIDSEPYKLTLNQAEAAYLAAKSTFQRTEQLYKANATSKQNYDQAKAQYDATQSQYELARLNFQYTRIVSPVSGVVLMKHADEGSLVAPQVPIVTIGNLDDLVVKAKIPEKHYSFFLKHEKTMKIQVELPDLPETKADAKIKTVSPYISPDTKTFETVCTLSGDTSMLRPGMFIYLTFVLDEKRDVYSLPFKALIAGNTLWYVDPETCTARKIEFSPEFYNDASFQISEKYKEYGFIIEGQHFIQEGQKCRVLNEPDFCSERKD